MKLIWELPKKKRPRVAGSWREGRDREKYRIFYEFSPKRVGTWGGVAYIYIYVYMYIYIYTYIDLVCFSSYIYIYIYIHMCVYMHVFIADGNVSINMSKYCAVHAFKLSNSQDSTERRRALRALLLADAEAQELPKRLATRGDQAVVGLQGATQKKDKRL